MKRSMSRPIILPLPTYEMNSRRVKPRILPFPGCCVSGSAIPAEPRGESDAEVSAIRDRLFRMIVSNQWDRSHGNRAS